MLVIDASAVVELLLTTEMGHRVATVITGDQTLHAPELIGVELISVLRRLTRLGELSVDDARRLLVDFGDLGIELYEHTPLLGRAFDLRESVSAYDAVYVALAEAVDAPLLTCDAKLAGASGHAAVIQLVR